MMSGYLHAVAEMIGATDTRVVVVCVTSGANRRRFVGQRKGAK